MNKVLTAEKSIEMHVAYVTATPESPLQVAVDDVDEASVTLKWNKPKSDGGKKIDGYVIEYKEPSSNRWKTYNEVPLKETLATGKS